MISPIEIELATYVSWPAFEQVDYKGWIVRFADGVTKRANSVNVIVPTCGAVAEAVADCEAFYRMRKQPAIFRLLSFVDDPRLESYLADAGYTYIDLSLVMSRTLDQEPEIAQKPIAMNRETWLQVYNEVFPSDPAKHAGHAEILRMVPGASLFTVLEHEGEPVACGLGVIHESYFGIFDIVTRSQDRQRGHGTELIRRMLAWAQQNGARHAYVQVMAHNAPAVRLYEKLGYRRLYHYWYRVQRLPLVNQDP